MDTVAGLIEADPDRSHGIIGARLQNEFSIQCTRFRRFGENLRVERVIGIWRDDFDMQLAYRPFFDFLRNAAREMRDQVRALVERFQARASREIRTIAALPACGDCTFGT